MELVVIKSGPISIILLLLLLLSRPYFSTGSLDVYEIDYRGPETHSSIPPPDHSHGRRHWVHRETDVSPPHKSSKALKGGGGGGGGGGNIGRNSKKIHG